MTSFDQLSAAERRVVSAIGRARSASPDETLASFAEDGKPAVEGGRLVRIRLYRSVTSLDLRGLDALVEVSTVYAGRINEIQLGGNDALTRLALARNEVRTLELRGCPALRELDLQANRLTGLTHLPEGLRTLVVGANPNLVALDLGGLSALEELLVFGTGLRSLDLAGLRGLRALGAAGTALAAVDLSALTALESVDLDDTGAKVTLPKSKRMRSLRAARCELDACDATGWPALTELIVPACGLRSLRLDNPRLQRLDLERNALASIDLTTTPRIASLKLAGNPMTEVDLRPLDRLDEATLPKGAEIRCTALQGEVVEGLRARRGLTAKPAASVAKMDAFGLHRFVSGYNWDDGLEKLVDVVRHPHCDRATALLVYWQSQPGEHTASSDAATAPAEARATVELLREIEAKDARGGFTTARIPFDVHDLGGVDLSDDDPKIPARMREPVKPAKGVEVVLPGDGRKGAAAKPAAPTKAAPKTVRRAAPKTVRKATPKQPAAKQAAPKQAAAKQATPKQAAAKQAAPKQPAAKKKVAPKQK